MEIYELLVCEDTKLGNIKNIIRRHCTWIPELTLELYFTHTLRMYWRKMDPRVPPEVDDGSNEDVTGKIDDKEKV